MAEILSEPPTAGGPDRITETLDRLSKKADIKATMVLDTDTGVILRATGPWTSMLASSTSSTATGPGTESEAPTPSEPRTVQELANTVLGFYRPAGFLVQELDKEDELKVLRLRTKKHELWIVPNPLWILVVLHATPPA